MNLGIDFGTTRIVVAAADRGNYPVIAFDSPEGDSAEWFPSLIAVCGEERRYGWDAYAVSSEPDWTMIRSIKRLLEDAAPDTPVQLGQQSVPLLTLLTEMVSALRNALLRRSRLPQRDRGNLRIMLGVPANANSAQRYLTAEAFRRAGFDVLGLLNEPSAASIEYGHREKAGRDTLLFVYDLGGGTFDASLVSLHRHAREVVATEGVSTLGGDDFDELLAQLALDAAGIPQPVRDGLDQAELFRLYDECRVKKEALHVNSRKVAIDLESVREGWGTVAIPVGDFYAVCRPLVEETLHAVQDLLDKQKVAARDARLEAVYLTGGGSELPPVARILREEFGRKVKRSPHSRASTAIGLAIQADDQAGYTLRESLNRHFGVWREGDNGRRIIFDSLFQKGIALDGPLHIERRYQAVHNIGHYRFLECSRLDDEGQPAGSIALWDEIRVPFDPSLPADGWEQESVRQISTQPRIVEEYAVDADGVVTVTLRNEDVQRSWTFQLRRWASSITPVVPGKRKRKTTTAE